jgi:hypothetical protein
MEQTSYICSNYNSMKREVKVSLQNETRSECTIGDTGVKSIEFQFEAN